MVVYMLFSNFLYCYDLLFGLLLFVFAFVGRDSYYVDLSVFPFFFSLLNFPYSFMLVTWYHLLFSFLINVGIGLTCAHLD